MFKYQLSFNTSFKIDPVFLAGIKSGNVGRATLDNSNVDCADDDDDDCCLLYPGRDEGCDYSA